MNSANLGASLAQASTATRDSLGRYFVTSAGRYIFVLDSTGALLDRIGGDQARQFMVVAHRPDGNSIGY